MKRVSASFSVNTVVLLLSLISNSTICNAGEVQIVDVKAEYQSPYWLFNVTLKHDDKGWDHYADAWRVVSEDGKELAKRTLYHPHVDEQPFTRSLGNIEIPQSASFVYVEAHDKVHGWSKQRFKVKLR